MRLRATVTVEYDADGDAYGGEDAIEAAAIDQAVLEDDPTSIVMLGDYVVKVEPVQ